MKPSPSSYRYIVEQTELFSLDKSTNLEEEKKSEFKTNEHQSCKSTQKQKHHDKHSWNIIYNWSTQHKIKFEMFDKI